MFVYVRTSQNGSYWCAYRTRKDFLYCIIYVIHISHKRRALNVIVVKDSLLTTPWVLPV